MCSRCKRELDVNLFSKNRSRKDGLCHYCKICVKEVNEINKLKRKEYSKKYCENNKEKIRESSKNYREKNKEKSAEYSREYYKNNREERVEYGINYYKNNKEKRKKYSSKYYIINNEKFKETGKIYKNSKSLFNTFSSKLTVDEAPISDIDGYMQVKCTYCGKYFYPTNRNVMTRIRALDGKHEGEHRLYCSDNCKRACPIFHKQTITPGLEEATSREVQPQLRQLVLARDEYRCVKCGKSVDDIQLHCHHIDPVNMNDIESADVDNCVTLCIDCHHEVHRYSWCKTRC